VQRTKFIGKDVTLEITFDPRKCSRVSDNFGRSAMFPTAKSAILSAALLSGAAVCAHAQSTSIAALPPGAPATPAPQAVVVAPSAQYAGPNAGKLWSAQERQTQPVQSPQAYLGPALTTTDQGVDSE
jgi:hypothetical protein